MTSESLAWSFQVNDRLEEINKRLDGESEFNTKIAPGLKDLVHEYVVNKNPDAEKERFIRDLLSVFKKSETDGTFSEVLAKHSSEEETQIRAFVDGKSAEAIGKELEIGPSLGCREELQKLHESPEIAHVSAAGVTRLQVTPNHEPTPFATRLETHFENLVHEFSTAFHNITHNLAAGLGKHESPALQSTSSLVVYQDAPFQNWGLTVNYVPEFTCVPTTIKAVQTVVAFAKSNDMSVRCAGYRHSWSPIYGKKGHITISMLDLHSATKLPNTTSLPLPESPPTELETIEIVEGSPREKGNKLLRIGCATTNERLRRWCVKNGTVTLPFNVILVEVTLGGTNAPVCHGAGLKSTTLSDLVRKIEYIDAHGKLQTVTKPEHLRAASGCFGLMGIVTHLTLEFSPMTYALLEPKKMPVICAIPPPADLDEKKIPAALLKWWKPLSAEAKNGYQKDFERRAQSDYYAEWFWFPYSDYAWVNTWNTTTDRTGVVDFPSKGRIVLSWLQTVAMNIIQNAPLLDDLINLTGLNEAAVTLISRAALLALPSSNVKTYVSDALHFQRAIQNVRVRDVEVEIPLVAKRDDASAIDWQIVQRAWWDAILLAYAPENTKHCPMRMPLEMRVTGGSDVTLAPQRGNKLGTCAIEVLTLKAVPPKLWGPFAQSAVDKWMALKDPNTDKPLRTRPHWAKEWIEYKVNGKPWIERLRTDYSSEREEFLNILADIGHEAGWTLADVKARFSNVLFDDFFFSKPHRSLHGESSTATNVKTTATVSVEPVAEVHS